jgi:aspartate/methionine/tyrosine aminotransferase
VVAGGEPLCLPATRASGFLPHLDRLDPTTLKRLALFYLCSPANPQGAIASADYLSTLYRLALDYDFLLVVDECYAEIYYDAPPPGALSIAFGIEPEFRNLLVFHSLSKRSNAAGLRSGFTAAASPAIKPEFRNLLVFHSLSKRSNAAGLRSGFIAGDAAAVRRFLELRAYAAAVQPLPLLAAATRLWQDEEHVEANRQRYRQKFALAEAILGDCFGFYRPAGGFFLWLEVGDGEAFARRAWCEAGVKLLPGAYLSATAGPNAPGAPYVRAALVDAEPVVETALQRLRTLAG